MSRGVRTYSVVSPDGLFVNGFVEPEVHSFPGHFTGHAERRTDQGQRT